MLKIIYNKDFQINSQWIERIHKVFWNKLKTAFTFSIILQLIHCVLTIFEKVYPTCSYQTLFSS